MTEANPKLKWYNGGSFSDKVTLFKKTDQHAEL